MFPLYLPIRHPSCHLVPWCSMPSHGRVPSFQAPPSVASSILNKLRFHPLIGVICLTSCTGRRPHSAPRPLAPLHAALPVRKLSLMLQLKPISYFCFFRTSFRNSWSPSFRFVLPRQYFKNIISLFSLFLSSVSYRTSFSFFSSGTLFRPLISGPGVIERIWAL